MNHNAKEARPLFPQPVPAQHYQHPDDEISLVDLWLILAKRKMLLLTSCLLLLILGALVAGLVPPKLTYVTSINIGKIGPDKPLEKPESVVAKLTELYVPLSRKIDEPGVAINVKNPAGSLIILLESEAPADKQQLIKEKHSEVINMLFDEHTVVYDTFMKMVEGEIASAEFSMKELINVKAAQHIDPPVLNIQLANLQRDITNLKLKQISARRSAILSETQAMKETKKSLVLFSVLGLILGLIVGILAVFFSEFLNKVAKVQKERSTVRQ